MHDPVEPHFQDALLTGTLRGRGAGINPGNRFEDVKLHVLGEHLDEIAISHPDGAKVPTRVFKDSSKSILNPVDSPDLRFKWTVNPYRGCEHGCIYCYARPGHEYLGMSCGVDFETRIFAKPDAPELLRAELTRPKWNGEGIMLSGVTDCYQPIEQELRITRRIVELCVELAQPISIITKNKLITRDLDLFVELNKHHAIHAAVSITTLDNKLASTMEPRASSPRDRLRIVRELSDAGIPVAVMVAPVIPTINESEIPAILEAAKDAGARSAGTVLLRLPWQIKALYLDWLRREFPERAAHAESALRDTREGELYQSDFSTRQRGTGARAEQIRTMFNVFARRLQLDGRLASVNRDEFHRRKRLRTQEIQGGLFQSQG